jgi:hypothetical protein
MSDIDRRQLLAALAGAAAIQPALADSPKRELIAAENDRDGTLDWQLTYTRVDPKTKWRSPMIEGFASRTSVRGGDALAFFVSTDPATPFNIDIYRLGYYRGKGGRHMLRLGPYNGKPQPTPPVGEKRLRECQWESCTTLYIPKDWPSGVYLGKLTATNRDQASVSELRRIYRPRRSGGGFRLPVQRQHLAGVQPVAGRLFALHQRTHGQEAARLRRARELRPAVREVRADLR